MVTAPTPATRALTSILDDPSVTEQQPQTAQAGGKRSSAKERCAHRNRRRRCAATGRYTLAGFPGSWCEHHASSILAAGRRTTLPHTPAFSTSPLAGQTTLDDAIRDATADAGEGPAAAVAVLRASAVLRGSPTPRPAVSKRDYRTGHCTRNEHHDCPGLVARLDHGTGRAFPLACACSCHPDETAGPEVAR